MRCDDGVARAAGADDGQETRRQAVDSRAGQRQTYMGPPVARDG